MSMTKQEMLASAWVCVLADSETYTGLDGCWIAVTSQEVVEALDEGHISLTELSGGRYDLQSLLEFGLEHGYFDHEAPDDHE